MRRFCFKRATFLAFFWWLAIAVPAAAQITLLGVGPGGIAPAASSFATWRGLTTSTANATSYTFSAVAIGPADANRWAVFFWASSGANPTLVTGVTVNGSSSGVTCDVAQASNVRLMHMCRAPIPSGTTADFAITTDVSVNRMAVGVWTFNTTQTAPAGISGATSTLASSTSTMAIGGTMNLPTGGTMFAASMSTDTSGATVTWTPATGSCASRVNVALEAAITISACDGGNVNASQTITASGPTTSWKGAAMTWGP